VLSQCFALLCRIGAVKKRLWRGWYDYLAGYRQVSEWTCMNYGYAGLDEPRTCDVPPDREPERWCLQLYHHLASAVPLAGREVLEVGSGRGGGAVFVKQALRPARYTGVDFSDRAVALCHERYQIEGLSFVQGDAENLPAPAASVDAVINVESSHCYGDFPKFVREVARVLRPGGHFLHADFRDAQELEKWRGQLLASGLELVSATDITPNVLAALDRDDVRKRTMIQKLIPRWLLKSFQDFAGTKGSLVQRMFASGEMKYWAFVLRRPQ
jgi:ubiquinone/menaquinone biosynthesis C-methylase UbiE